MADDTLSDDDKALFRDTMRMVTPLKQRKIIKIAPERVLRVKPLRNNRTPEIRPPSTTYYLSDHYTQIVMSDTTLSYCKQPIPQKRFNQLKKGQIPWEARLDLHGLKPDSARDALCHFIDHQSSTDHRCLLIIHGKGSLHGEAPILKNLVNHWLRQLSQVLAFHSAISQDGGNGALYVLLQRQRPKLPGQEI